MIVGFFYLFIVMHQHLIDQMILSFIITVMLRINHWLIYYLLTQIGLIENHPNGQGLCMEIIMFRKLQTHPIEPVLIESRFITNSDDEKMMNDPEYQDRYVRGLYKGLKAYFNLK